MAIKRQVKVIRRNIFVAIVSKPSGGYANLARCLEGEIPWHHLTFGHLPEVDESPHPFFYATLEKLMPGVEVKVRQALIYFDRKL